MRWNPDKTVLVLRKAVRRLGRELGLLSQIRYEMSFLVEMLERKRVSLVLDVGANVGQWTVELRRAGYRGRVVSVEPVASAHAALSRAASNDAAWTVSPRMAVGDHEGTTIMRVASNSPMSSTMPAIPTTLEAIPGADTIGTETVPLTTLEKLLERYASPTDIVFLKLDVQGDERSILRGSEHSVERFEGLQLELSFTKLYENEASALELYSFIVDHEFTPYLFIPGYYSSRFTRQLQVDGVFFKTDFVS